MKLRFIHWRMKEGPVFKLEYWKGDDQWRSSFHINWVWLRRHHWFCVFLPEWMP